ncbi:MAG: 4-hydroxybenzoate octaprenyltransferase [Pseudomonadota bacterium]
MNEHSAPGGFLQQLGAYARLMRLDRPAGIWLLAWPMMWALWIAGEGRPDENILIIFMLGAVITRSAGCIINDCADRNLDGQVARPRERPLATGEVSSTEALILFAGLGLLGIGLALMLNQLSQIVAVAAVVLIIVYPFMKRFVSVPQLVLGLAFGCAVPMAFAALTNELPRVAWFLYAITALWAIIYDTMYAMCDREDDLVAGIRSTAILFGDTDRFVVGAMQVTMLMALTLLGQQLNFGGWYIAALVGVALLMGYQQHLIRQREPSACLQAFLNNQFVGLVLFAGIALDYLYRAPAA